MPEGTGVGRSHNLAGGKTGWWALRLMAASLCLILACQSARVERITGEFKVTYLECSGFNYNVIGLKSSDGWSYIVLSERVFLDVDTLSPGCALLEVGNTYKLTLEERRQKPQLWSTQTYFTDRYYHYRVRDVLTDTSDFRELRRLRDRGKTGAGIWDTCRLLEDDFLIDGASDTSRLLNHDFSFRVKVYRSPDIVDGYVLVAGETCRPCDRDLTSTLWLIQDAVNVPAVQELIREHWVNDSLAIPPECLSRWHDWWHPKCLCLYGDCLKGHWLSEGFGLIDAPNGESENYIDGCVLDSPTSYANRLEFQVLDINGDDAHLVFDFPPAGVRCDLRFHCWGWGWTLVSSEIRPLGESP